MKYLSGNSFSTPANTDEYRNNYDKIFRKKEEEPKPGWFQEAIQDTINSKPKSENVVWLAEIVEGVAITNPRPVLKWNVPEHLRDVTEFILNNGKEYESLQDFLEDVKAEAIKRGLSLEGFVNDPS